MACGLRFYEAAPPLTPGEMSYAIRTLANLHDLSTARTWTKAEADALALELMTAGAAVLDRPARLEDIAATMGALLRRNGDEAYRAATANFLHEIMDMASTNVPKPERNAYIRWRMGAAEDDRGIATEQPRNGPAVLPWMAGAQKAAAEAAVAAREQKRMERRTRMNALAGTASPELRPFFEVQHAAQAFRAHDFLEAMALFERTVKDHPQHPRAETAEFMALRCRIEIARDAARAAGRPSISHENIPELQQAWQAFHDFSQRRPNGRYRDELLGWEGALHVIGGNYAAAFLDYAAQAETPGHPEIVRQALHEAERCLIKLSGPQGDPSDLHSVASELPRYPRAAMRMVYFMIEPAGTVDYTQWPWGSEHYQESGGADGPDRLARRWRIRAEGRRFLQELASAVMDRQFSNRVTGWDPFAVAVLAWQATESGDHPAALALCRKYPALLEKSDDLQTVRAIALQRAGRTEDAITAWRELVSVFPHSSLADQAQQRLVALLNDAGRPAEALVMIMESGARTQDIRDEASAKGMPVVYPGPDR